MNRFLLVLSGIILVAWLFANALTGWRVPGFEPEDIALASEMFPLASSTRYRPGGG